MKKVLSIMVAFCMLLSLGASSAQNSEIPETAAYGSQTALANMSLTGKVTEISVNSVTLQLGELSISENAPEHKDPFDKLLLAQAKSEDFFLLTHDKKLLCYDEDCLINV